jgi:hypothetical protein
MSPASPGPVTPGPSGQRPTHGLKIRARKSTKRSANPNQPGAENKQAVREFLSLLPPSDYERAVAFMGVTTTSDIRVHLNTVMKRASAPLRVLLLDFMSTLDVPTCEKLLTQLAPLSEEQAERLFRLQWEIDWDRFLELVVLPQGAPPPPPLPRKRSHQRPPSLKSRSERKEELELPNDLLLMRSRARRRTRAAQRPPSFALASAKKN